MVYMYLNVIGPRSLAEIVKLPLLQRESKEEVKRIWETQHEVYKTL